MKKILIVEDELLILSLYKMKLEKAKYKVETAKNGEDGFQKTKKFKPDLIILDILMPKVDGYQMLKMMREEPKTKNIPVIIMTNTPSLPNARESQTLGVVKGLFKADVTPSQLVSYIKEFFRKQMKN